MKTARKLKDQSETTYGGPVRKAVQRVKRTRRLEGTDIITDDLALLKALGLSIPEAAGFLGKTRQALSVQLAGPNATRSYFKLSDLVILVLGARQIALVDETITDYPFDFDAIARYLEETRGQEKNNPTYALLLGAIGRDGAIDLDEVEVAAFIVPAVVELTSKRPDIASRIVDLTRQMARIGRPRASILLSSTELQVKVGVQSVLREQDQVIEIIDPAVERYVPMVVLFDENKTTPRVYMFVENGGLVEAPHYRAEVLGAWIKANLSDADHRQLFREPTLVA
jgi:hypothetical protein